MANKMRTYRAISSVCAVAVVALALWASPAQAVPVVLSENTLTELLGSGFTPMGADKTVTPMSAMDGLGNLVLEAEVFSRAYKKDGEELYAYLYQIVNSTNPNRHPVEQFTLWPFEGADGGTVMGMLDGVIPAEFLTGGQDPEPTGNVKLGSLGPIISFYYGDRAGAAIHPSEHSRVMFVLSELAPDDIIGNIIDGTVATGPVVGPLPEPAALSILGLGGVVILLKRRRKA